MPALLVLALAAHAAPPVVALTEGSERLPPHFHGHRTVTLSWTCDDPDDGGPLAATCAVWDVTDGRPFEAGAEQLLEEPCGADLPDPAAGDHALFLAFPVLRRTYAMTVTCTDADGEAATALTEGWSAGLPPLPVVASGPPGVTADRSASFELTCDDDAFDADWSFTPYRPWCDLTCRLLGAGGAVLDDAACDQRVTAADEAVAVGLQGLTPGAYTLEITATDALGRSREPVRHRWEVREDAVEAPDTDTDTAVADSEAPLGDTDAPVDTDAPSPTGDGCGCAGAGAGAGLAVVPALLALRRRREPHALTPHGGAG